MRGWLAGLVLVLALPPGPVPAPRMREQPIPLLWGRPVDLNRAAPHWLEVLPGIGPARARAIAAARPVAGVEDLLRVDGIGPRTVARLRGLAR